MELHSTLKFPIRRARRAARAALDSIEKRGAVVVAPQRNNFRSNHRRNQLTEENAQGVSSLFSPVLFRLHRHRRIFDGLDRRYLSDPLMAGADDHPTKLLFVCSRNRIRSLTAERIFSSLPGVHVRSAGTQPDARIVVTEGHIGWADIIFLMEKSHLNRVRLKFPEALQGKQTVTLLIPDEYVYMQPELIDELTTQVSRYVKLP
jgi:predicted protein tyrosine phosphatase